MSDEEEATGEERLWVLLAKGLEASYSDVKYLHLRPKSAGASYYERGVNIGKQSALYGVRELILRVLYDQEWLDKVTAAAPDFFDLT